MGRCPTEGRVGVLISFGCILLWYTFSIGLTFYNKWLFSSYGLRFPLSVTSCHMILNFILAWGLRTAYRCVYGKSRPTLSPENYYKLALPTGAAGGLDVGLGNTSLSFITISLYTICKSTSIVFLVLFAFCFHLEKPRWSLAAVIACIALGVFLFTWGGTTDFNLFGFILVMIATIMSGLRWVLAQLMMTKEGLGMNNPLDTLYHITPTMALVLLPLALAFEGVSFFSSQHMFAGTTDDTIRTLLIVSAGGILAFLLNWSEFLLIHRTSSVTMAVAGIFKELCTIVFAVLIFGDSMTVINGVGMSLTIVGIILYNVFKYKQTVHAKDKHGDGPYAALSDVSAVEMRQLEDDGHGISTLSLGPLQPVSSAAAADGTEVGLHCNGTGFGNDNGAVNEGTGMRRASDALLKTNRPEDNI